MRADTTRIQFVCVRAAHHRRGTRAEGLCAYLGCAAYCPAGDIGAHDWMPASTDVATLARLGYLRTRDEAERESDDQGLEDDPPILVRT